MGPSLGDLTDIFKEPPEYSILLPPELELNSALSPLLKSHEKLLASAALSGQPVFVIGLQAE